MMDVLSIFVMTVVPFLILLVWLEIKNLKGYYEEDDDDEK